MTDEEAMDKALSELGHRAEQMTEAEFQEAVIDRARELAGRPKLARLSQGRRLAPAEMMQLQVGIDGLLSDFYKTIHLGDARWDGSDLVVLFRFTARPDVPYIIRYGPAKGTAERARMDLREAGKSIALQAYDKLTPERVVQIMKAKPIK